MRRLDTFEKQVERAQNAVYDAKIDAEKEWLYELLYILKGKNYATITGKNGSFIDVQRIAYTHDFASFFDIVNNLHRVDIDALPIVTEKLTYPYKNLFTPSKT